MIKYIKDDLFNAPGTQLLCHACNCQGVWGSGIAKEFKERFFTEYLMYNVYSRLLFQPPEPEINVNAGSQAIGSALILNRVGCLFTSFDYGKNVDSPEEILENTKTAFKELLKNTTMDLAMPKINSGLFKVPWKETEKVILEVLEETGDKRTIYVYSLE